MKTRPIRRIIRRVDHVMHSLADTMWLHIQDQAEKKKEQFLATYLLDTQVDEDDKPEEVTQKESRATAYAMLCGMLSEDDSNEALDLAWVMHEKSRLERLQTGTELLQHEILLQSSLRETSTLPTVSRCALGSEPGREGEELECKWPPEGFSALMNSSTGGTAQCEAATSHGIDKPIVEGRPLKGGQTVSRTDRSNGRSCRVDGHNVTCM